MALKPVSIHPAKGLLAWALRRSGYRGITLPPFGVYLLPCSLTCEPLIAHELVHWEQARRMGVLRFYATYLWFQLRYGYERNPMEIEARRRSGCR